MGTALTQVTLDQLPLRAGSEEAYIQTVNRIPVLGSDEEHDLAVAYRDSQDLDAARRLVLAHLRFVVHVARGYSGYGLPLADLIQEGNVGLMKAVKRFDPEIKVRLVSFAVHWIRAEIHEYILRNWRIVKVATTKAQRKLFFNLRSSKKRLGWLTHDEVNTVAQDLGVKPETVLEMESRMSAQDMAYDPPTETDGDEHEGPPRSPAAFLAAQDEDPAGQVEAEDWDGRRVHGLHSAMERLDDRSRDIVQRRWLADQKTTLQDLADQYGVSAERVRQLEKNAMQRMRTAMEV